MSTADLRVPGTNYHTWTLPRINDYFAASPEFQERYGQLGNGEFVDLVYANMMRRKPDAGGRTYWINQLEGGMNRGRVMSFFGDSPEYKNKTRSG